MVASMGSFLPKGPPENQSYTEAFGVPEYLIGPGDVLQVSIWREHQEEQQSLQVRSDGTISFMFFHDLHVGELTPRQADRVITDRVSTIIQNPVVDVSIKVYNSKKIRLSGAISSIALGTGGQIYPLEGKTRLLDIISKSGGLVSNARLDRVVVSRGGKTAFFDLNQVWTDGDTTQNPVLEGGDTIYVPWGTEKRAFVVGEVLHPGVYLLSDDATVLEAVMQAGGFTSKAMRDDVRVVRSNRGSPVMFSVDIKRLIDDKDLRQNVGIEPGDVVYVPKSLVGRVIDTVGQTTTLLTFLVLVATLQLR
jgi:polysaccharide export outer membrane protein